MRGIAQPEMIAGSSLRRALLDNRHDGADDQVPVGIDRERHHRLDVQCRPAGVPGAIAAVIVELERKADQFGYRVGQLLRQIGVTFALGGARLGLGSGGGQQQDGENRQAKHAEREMRRHPTIGSVYTDG
ncbi:MAG: hypothetical protein V4601_02855 [Pseudomonadota bacterium]